MAYDLQVTQEWTPTRNSGTQVAWVKQGSPIIAQFTVSNVGTLTDGTGYEFAVDFLNNPNNLFDVSRQPAILSVTVTVTTVSPSGTIVTDETVIPSGDLTHPLDTFNYRYDFGTTWGDSTDTQYVFTFTLETTSAGVQWANAEAICDVAFASPALSTPEYGIWPSTLIYVVTPVETRWLNAAAATAALAEIGTFEPGSGAYDYTAAYEALWALPEQTSYQTGDAWFLAISFAPIEYLEDGDEKFTSQNVEAFGGTAPTSEFLASDYLGQWEQDRYTFWFTGDVTAAIAMPTGAYHQGFFARSDLYAYTWDTEIPIEEYVFTPNRTISFGDTILVYDDFPAGNAGYGKYMRVIGSDVEFNANQVASYVQNMLGFTVSPGYLCPALGTTWTTPEGDEAWWYDANRPESGEFLGAIITKIVGLNSTMSRKPITHGSGIGGSILGPLRSSARAIGFETVIYATTCRGMEYGKRVIIDGLRGRGCRSNCELDEIEIWTCCPGESGAGELDPEPRWRIKRVGLTEGPVEGDPPMPTRQCNVRSLKWVMTSESPWLYKETETQITGAHFTLNGDPVPTETCWDVCDWIWDELEVTCVLMSAEGIGETASIIYISSGDSKFTGTITVRDVENADEDDPLLRYEIYELPANKTLIIDSSSHQILTLDNVTGLVTPDGGRYLYTTGGGIPFKFITVNSACSDRRICITTTPGNMDTTASVRIDLVHREL